MLFVERCFLGIRSLPSFLPSRDIQLPKKVTTGLCLSGFFRVKLMQRKVDAFDGVEVWREDAGGSGWLVGW